MIPSLTSGRNAHHFRRSDAQGCVSFVLGDKAYIATGKVAPDFEPTTEMWVYDPSADDGHKVLRCHSLLARCQAPSRSATRPMCMVAERGWHGPQRF